MWCVHSSWYRLFWNLFEDSESLKSVLEDIDVSSKDIIFVPVNNNTNIDSPGGSHWSLLVWTRKSGTFLYLDSMTNYNKSSAIQLKDILGECYSLGTDIEYIDTPQQKNSYDCGVFVLCFIQFMLEHPESLNGDFSALKSSVNQNVATKKRKEIYELIATLRKQREIKP